MAQLLEYKCPCCGGIIEFDSGSQMMKCPYCDTTFDPSALLEMDEALNNHEPDQLEWETPQSQFDDAEISGMSVYSCHSVLWQPRCADQRLFRRAEAGSHHPL